MNPSLQGRKTARTHRHANLGAWSAILLVAGFSAQAATNTVTTPPVPKRGYVNVRIGTIKSQVARQMNRNETDIPESVEAPVEVAARACEISAAELARREREGNMTCDAKRTTIGLNDAVREHIQSGSSQMGGQVPSTPSQPGTSGSTGSTTGTTTGSTSGTGSTTGSTTAGTPR